ncbi:MAG: saccharopine dehydrogenase NADP-binding domain-containing protein, partial [Anaerolineales bacterium]|nr:saccharopine dehydrogenase NADP-binding domain-containing protein [Anaerolineales bacterium]
MKVLIFGGSGKMGAAVAWDLVKEDDVDVVGLVGRHEDTLQRVSNWVNSPKVKTHILDVADIGPAIQLMQGYDIGVIALPDRRTSYKIIHTAIEAGLDIVDMLEEYHRRPDPYETEGLEVPDGMSINEYGEWLHEQAVE